MFDYIIMNCINVGSCVTWIVLSFWEISKNYLAGLQSCQATHVEITKFLGFCKEPLGGDELSPDESLRFWLFWGFGWCKVTLNV